MSISSTAINVYVTTSGNDSNAGTSVSPKATIAGALAIAPDVLGGSFNIHFASGIYAAAPIPAIDLVRPFAAINYVGDGAGQLGDDGFQVVATGALGIGSTSSILQLAVPVSANAFQFMTLEMTSGVAVGLRRLVSTNTTTAVSLDAQLDNTVGTLVPAAGDTFRVIRPAVVISCLVSSTTLVAELGGNPNLINIALTPSIASAQLVTAGGPSPALWFGVELRNQLSVVSQGALVAGTSFQLGPIDFVRRVFNSITTGLGLSVGLKQWQGWGLSSIDAGGVLVETAGRGFFGGFVTGQASVLCSGADSGVELFGGYCNDIFVAAACGRFVARNSGATLFVATLGALSTRSPIDCAGDAVFESNVEITQGGTAIGIQARGTGTLVFFGTVLHSSAVSTQIAVNATDVAQLRFVGAITSSNSLGSGFQSSRSASVSFEGIASFTQSSTLGTSNVARTSRVNANAFTLIGGIFIVNGSGIFTCSGAFSFTNANTPTAAVRIEQNGKVSFGGACTIQNTNATAGSDGMRVNGNGQAFCQNNPTITQAAASGYGLNCRGGGRFVCPVQPAGIVGATADFTVGVGLDFPDTALAASLSFVENGPTSVSRSA